MFPKYFVTLCGLVLFIAITSGASAVEEDSLVVLVQNDEQNADVAHDAEVYNPVSIKYLEFNFK